MYACVLVFVIICDIFCCKIEVFRIFLDCCSVAFFCQLIFVECVIIIVIVILFINLWQILVVIVVRIVFTRVVCSKFKTWLFCFGLKFCKIASIQAPLKFPIPQIRQQLSFRTFRQLYVICLWVKLLYLCQIRSV